MASWALDNTQPQLEQIVRSARESGPQIITEHGVEQAVVLPIESWQQPSSEKKRTLIEVLLNSPELDFEIPDRHALRLREPVIF